MPIETNSSRTVDKSVNLLMLALAVVAIAIGGGIYVVFRSMSLRMFGWFATLGITDAIVSVREMCQEIVPNRFVLYNLPDLLWISAYILLVNVIIPISRRKSYLFWMLLMPIMAIAHEILQGFGIMNGSFDFVDLLCYIIPTVINLIYFHYEKIL